MRIALIGVVACMTRNAAVLRSPGRGAGSVKSCPAGWGARETPRPRRPYQLGRGRRRAPVDTGDGAIAKIRGSGEEEGPAVLREVKPEFEIAVRYRYFRRTIPV
jgi:hypothetical protein